MSTPTMRVLLVGGPADGRWVMTAERVIVIANPAPFTWTGDLEPIAERTTYQVDAISVLGHRVYVAMSSDLRMSRDRDKAVIRALMQRDVAAVMGAT